MATPKKDTTKATAKNRRTDPTVAASRDPVPTAARRDARRPVGDDAANRTASAPDEVASIPPSGIDEARHRKAQYTAQQAEALREVVFPAIMSEAMGHTKLFDGQAFKLFMERLLDEAGNPSDPIERMMLQQLALAHFRIGQLHVSAGQSKTVEAAKAYNSAASRLWGEFRRTALALRCYKTQMPERKSEAKLKLFKAAQ